MTSSCIKNHPSLIINAHTAAPLAAQGIKIKSQCTKRMTFSLLLPLGCRLRYSKGEVGIPAEAELPRPPAAHPTGPGVCPLAGASVRLSVCCSCAVLTVCVCRMPQPSGPAAVCWDVCRTAVLEFLSLSLSLSVSLSVQLLLKC